MIIRETFNTTRFMQEIAALDFINELRDEELEDGKKRIYAISDYLVGDDLFISIYYDEDDEDK